MCVTVSGKKRGKCDPVSAHAGVIHTHFRSSITCPVFFAGLRNPPDDATDLPWVSNASQLASSRTRAGSLRLQGKFTCVPSGTNFALGL